MLLTATRRPRNVDAYRAAALLYGDLGTSKAYVIGLAFAIAGYASFWLILGVSILTILIGFNYTIVCKYYPNGGGVYASVRKRSALISMIGAFFLVADFLVTASLSSLSAFNYFGVSDPVLYSAVFIGLIGLLNYFGPRHTGSLAFIVAVTAVSSLVLLAAFSLPFIPQALANLQPLRGSTWSIWKNFVGVIVALSGIEAIANTTGVMRLNPGSTEEKPIVTRTSTKAIILVLIEVAILTSLFGLATAAIDNFQVAHGTVNAPGEPNVRDYMLKYLGKVFASSLFGPAFGYAFSLILTITIGVLLLSAVNTAINGLVSLQYLMASDSEIPSYFQRLNRFGVPIFPLIVATLVPIVLVLVVQDVAGLAALYAVGFVGAIATNLGSTSTDKTLPLKLGERGIMFLSFLIMFFIEVTLFIDKPSARLYALVMIVSGLILRGLSREAREKKLERAKSVAETQTPSEKTPSTQSILCIAQKPGKALKAALDKLAAKEAFLYLLFIKEQEVLSEQDADRTWEKDEEAVALLDYVKKKSSSEKIHFIYAISDSFPDTVASYVMRYEVSHVIIDSPKRSPLIQILKGDLIRQIQKLLPEGVDLSVIN